MTRDNADAMEAALADRERLRDYARRILGDAHEAEDVAQEVALRAREAPRDLGSVGSWLRAVCYRLAVDRVRARRRRARIERTLAPPEVACSSPRALDERLDHESQARAVVARLETLPEPYRSALRLRYLEELDFPEIARRLGAPERTARTWVARGLGRLRADLAALGLGWWLTSAVVVALVLGLLALGADRIGVMLPLVYVMF